MFGNKMKELEAAVARLSAVVAAIGLDASATAEQAAAHVETLKSEAAQAAIEPLQAALAAAQSSSAETSVKFAALEVQAGAHKAALLAVDEALTRCGIHADLTSASPIAIAGAIETRIAAASAKIVAAAGHEPLAIAPADADEDDADTIAARLRTVRDSREAGRLAQRLIDLRQRACSSN